MTLGIPGPMAQAALEHPHSQVLPRPQRANPSPNPSSATSPQPRGERGFSPVIAAGQAFSTSMALTANIYPQIQFSHEENLIISIKENDLPFRKTKRDILFQLVLTLISVSWC